MNLSEFSLIEKIKKTVPNLSKDVVKGVGDDCAVIKVSKNKYLLTTCDSQVENVHFIRKISTPEQIGRKSVLVNISDIASMGGVPLYCLVSLVILTDIKQNFIDLLYNGIISECKNYNIQIIGGNISKGNQLVVDICMLGEVKSSELVLRSGAKVGDKVLVTGNLGEAAAGLELFLNKKISPLATSFAKASEVKKASEGFSFRKNKLILKQLVPEVRLKESQIIAKTKKASSMIDVSDGLSSDITHICEESKVGVILYENLLPISDSVIKLAKLVNKSPLDFAIKGGEDYELCFTVALDFTDEVLNKIQKKTNTKVTVIGEIVKKEKGKWLVLKNGKKKALKMTGWDHFSSHRK